MRPNMEKIGNARTEPASPSTRLYDRRPEMKKLAITSVMLACMALAACEGQTSRQLLLQVGFEKMSKTELVEFLSGKTESWGEDGGAYFSPDGKLNWIWKGELGAGTWKVTEKGILCYYVEEWYESLDHCNWEYYDDGEQVSSFDIELNKVDTFAETDHIEGDMLLRLSETSDIK